MTFWRTVGRSLRLRCPSCGEGRLFIRFFSMAPSCPGCGLDFRREQGYYVGAMYLNYGVTAAVELGYRLVLGRPPSGGERDRALSYIENDPARLKGFAWLLYSGGLCCWSPQALLSRPPGRASRSARRTG